MLWFNQKEKMMKCTVLGSVVAGCLLAGCSTVKTSDEWTYLFDAELSNFEVWMGVPHETVEGLPAGTYQSGNVHEGTPMGLDNDVKQVFTIKEEDGEPVLYVTGEIYGGLTTLDSFESYHLSIKAKWGNRKWEPRLDKLRDSGILYHCHGEHGSFWKVWKSSLECQVQETDLGDFIEIAGPKAKVRSSKKDGEGRPYFDPESSDYHGGYISANPEPDMPHGEWNTIEVYTVGTTSVHLANGQVVMVVEDAKKADGTPLTSGQIQLQSEAAEVYYKAMKIRNITEFPAEIKEQLRLKD